MLNIEKQAREVILEELAPYVRGLKPVTVQFRSAHQGKQVKCMLSHGDLHTVFFHSRVSNGPSVIRKIRADARTALRRLGLIKRFEKPIGALGEKIIEAAEASGILPPMKQNGQYDIQRAARQTGIVVDELELVSEPELLCPDAIAAQAKPKEEPTVTITQLQARVDAFAKPSGGRVTKTNRKHMSHDQLTEITKLLTKHGDVVNGAYVYAAGWSDERITDLTAPSTGLAGVIKVRRKSFGTMVNEVQQSKGERGKARIDQLEARLEAALLRITALEDAVTK